MKRQAHNKITFIQDGIEIPMTPSNRWKLIQEVIDPTTETYIKGNHEEWVDQYIGKIKTKFPSLTKELVGQYRSEKKSGAQLCKDNNINPNAFVAFCRYHQVSCDFLQCPVESKKKLQSKEWLEENIKKKNSEILAAELSVSPSLVLQWLHKHGIEWETGNRSRPEIELAEFIQSITTLDVKLNDRTIIKPKEIDVVIPELKIGFEMNGMYRHSWQKDKHTTKRNLATEQGFRLIQITDVDWDSKRALIQKKIKHILGVTDHKVFARKTIVSKTTNSDIRSFVDDNHIYGHKNCQHCYKLEVGGNTVAVMTFTKNHLERFCSSASVIGGFSKLFSFAMKDLNLSEVITFADLSWSDTNNNVYVKNGFTLERINNPNYWWVKGKLKLSRQKCQKHKLTKLKSYSPEKSETEIMKEEGFHKYFDAGHAKFIWREDQ